MSLYTPVAFFIFNRPDFTNIVFDSIAKVKPEKLLVVADGPRFPEEAEKCKQARSVIEKVDWNCKVLTNFSEKNIGCGKRVASGLDWVFSECEEAIILEDDCVPSTSFFYFCQTLLEYYRFDKRIMYISGSNFQGGQSRTDYSYYFSKYCHHMWGWASWKRAWKYYDFNMKTWDEFKKSNLIQSVCNTLYEQVFWRDMFERVFYGKIDTWDIQWYYTCWSQDGSIIVPNVNLVSNIGFCSDATHTFENQPLKILLSKLPIGNIGEIKHPPFIVRHREADAYMFDYGWGGYKMKKNLIFIIYYNYPKFYQKIVFTKVKLIEIIKYCIGKTIYNKLRLLYNKFIAL